MDICTRPSPPYARVDTQRRLRSGFRLFAAAAAALLLVACSSGDEVTAEGVDVALCMATAEKLTGYLPEPSMEQLSNVAVEFASLASDGTGRLVQLGDSWRDAVDAALSNGSGAPTQDDLDAMQATSAMLAECQAVIEES